MIRVSSFGFDDRDDLALLADVAEGFTTAQRALTLDTHRRVVLRCPRKTGRAQNSVGAARIAPTAFVPEPGENLPPASTEEAVAVLSGLQPGEDTFVFSNLVYMEALNDGWSQQAGAHFWEAAVSEAMGPFRR